MSRDTDTPPRAHRCLWFPDLECDELCFAIGCGRQGLLMKMRGDGVPDSEIGGPKNFVPEKPLP